MDCWIDGPIDCWFNGSMYRCIFGDLWRPLLEDSLNPLGSTPQDEVCAIQFLVARVFLITWDIYICLVLLLILESSLCLQWGKFNWFFLYIWIYRLNRHSSDWGFSTLAEVSKRAEQGFIPLTKNTQLNKILKKMWSEHYLALCYRFLFFIWASLSIYFWVLNIKWSYDINNNLHISLHFTLTLN